MIYLITASVVVITYFSLKWLSFYKKPKEWKHIPTTPALEGLYRAFTNPVPIDVDFEKYTLPFIDNMGMSTFCDLLKGFSLFVTDPDSLKQILKNTDIFVKEPIAEKNETLFEEHFGVQQVVSANGEDWKRMRKVMNPIFNRSWKPELFGECFNQVIEEWDKLEGKDILVHDQIQRMTLDVMGKAFFDFDFEAVRNPESKLYRLYHDITNGLFKDIAYLIFPILDHIPYLKRYALHAKVAEYNSFVESLIERRRQEILDGKANNDNLLTQFVQASMQIDDKEAVLSDRELRDNLKIFFVAGHDTTANTISAIIYYLARYPDVQTKLRSEIIEIMGESNSVRVPTVDELKQMDYLNMVIKESTRCMTTAAVLTRRAAKAFTFSNGVQVPEGRIVNLHMWGLFHNPKYFPEPNKFDPERFRDPNCEANKSWIPFLTGSRTCIGMSFSLMEQRVTLSMLVQAYTFQINPGHPDYEKLRLPVFGFPRPEDFKVDLIRRVPN